VATLLVLRGKRRGASGGRQAGSGEPFLRAPRRDAVATLLVLRGKRRGASGVRQAGSGSRFCAHHGETPWPLCSSSAAGGEAQAGGGKRGAGSRFARTTARRRGHSARPPRQAERRKRGAASGERGAVLRAPRRDAVATLLVLRGKRRGRRRAIRSLLAGGHSARPPRQAERRKRGAVHFRRKGFRFRFFDCRRWKHRFCCPTFFPPSSFRGDPGKGERPMER
jgi:hypothetical protein